jgi:hypothetical protein
VAKFHGVKPGDVNERDMNLLEKEKHKERSKTPTIISKYLYITHRITIKPNFKNSINQFFGDTKE